MSQQTINMYTSPIDELEGAIIAPKFKDGSTGNYKVINVEQRSDDKRVITVVNTDNGEERRLGVAATTPAVTLITPAKVEEDTDFEDSFDDADMDEALGSDNSDTEKENTAPAPVKAPAQKATKDDVVALVHVIDAIAIKTKDLGGKVSRRQFSNMLNEALTVDQIKKAGGKPIVRERLLLAGCTLTQHNIIWDGSEEGETEADLTDGSGIPFAPGKLADASAAPEHKEVEKALDTKLAAEKEREVAPKTAAAPKATKAPESAPYVAPAHVSSPAAVVLEHSTFADLATGLVALLEAGVITSQEARAFVL